MEELSIKEKARRYDEAFRIAQELYNDPNSSNVGKGYVCTVFPELKESEDERIRKEMIKGISKTRPNSPFLNTNITREAAIAWLEKQGEQKPATDNAEQKFKVGDWIVGANNVFKIISLNDKLNCYIAVTPSNEEVKIPYQFDNGQGHMCSYHLWTIQDAKDGDILTCESGWTCIFKALNDNNISFSSYCFMDKNGWFCETGSESHTLEKAFIKAYNGDIYPATKEQCDLLFQKMREAGYEWDTEKKELKKIEQKPVEWSEEDERHLNSIIKRTIAYGDSSVYGLIKDDIDWLKSIKERIQPKVEWSEEDKNRFNNLIFLVECSNENEPTKKGFINFINRLKFIRPQRQWKPSDEQVKQLGWIAKQNKDNMIGKELVTLYNDLKKLKG